MIYQLEYSQLAVEKTVILHTSWKVPSWLEIIKHLASWRDASQLECHRGVLLSQCNDAGLIQTRAVAGQLM